MASHALPLPVDSFRIDRERTGSWKSLLRANLPGLLMGFFDWLFGRKKDAYGGSFKKDYASAEKPPIKAHGGPPPPPPVQRAPSPSRPPAQSPRAESPPPMPPGPDRMRYRMLSWRRKRNRDGLAHVVNQPVRGEIWGTRSSPNGNPAQVSALGLPGIAHSGQLADQLGLTHPRLRQYLLRENYTNSSHYVARQLPKKSGGTRQLMVPKPKLKALQRALLEKLVRKLPLHQAVHGFRQGRDARSGATVHVDRDVVVCMDIADFFPSFDFRRVSGFFRSIGYSREVAVALGNLVTIRPFRAPGQWWAKSELPQGAPTSPGIANAICWRMDKRLAALARRFGGEYTRYADDLTFSGGAEMLKGAGRLVALVRKIVKTEGLELNEKKTRVMRSHTQQRVTGVVVNKQTNVARREYDRLKAILHNCIKHGPVSQNREQHPNFAEHLRGRIAHITHIGPKRGRKLKAMFEQINW